MMLAYVFWHWSAPSTTRDVYEQQLHAFHRAMAEHPAEGFHRSAAFRITGAPWLPQSDAYEDWYTVDNFASLEKLNEAAVSGRRKTLHDEAARLAAGGTAGIYKLVAGTENFAAFRHAVWITKPANTSYDAFFAQAGLLVRGQAALWQRQMTLGPASEFCLHSAERNNVPEQFAAIEIPLVAITVERSQTIERGHS